MAAKEVYVGEGFASAGDCYLTTVIVNGNEGNNLIKGTFGIKLNLAVLIGYAE